MNCDRIVSGTNSRKIREKLINKGKDLTLDKTIDIARTYELLQSQIKSMEAGEFMPSHGEDVPKVQESKPLHQYVQNKRPASAQGQ